jgi:hypothetical protein
LKKKEYVLRINRRDEAAQELVSGHRHVGDGGTVRVNSLTAGRKDIIAGARRAGCQFAADTNPRLHGIAADDGSDIHEHRHIHVTDFDDVQERLLFPRVCDGRAVIETVHGHGFRAEVRAAGKSEQADKGCPRHAPDGFQSLQFAFQELLQQGTHAPCRP